MNPTVIFCAGVLAGASLMLVIMQLMLASIKRSIRRIREIEELDQK